MHPIRLKNLTTAIKGQGVAGWSHSFQNRYSPHLCSEMSFSRRDWTAVLCWYPVSQDLRQTHSGTWLQSRITFPSSLVRMWQVFSKLAVHAHNLKSKGQLHSPCAVCWACRPPHLSSCRRTHPRMMLYYWSCESLYRSWGNPECYQLLLLILEVGNFKRWVYIIDFSTSFHQLGFFLSLSPSSTFIKWEQEYLRPLRRSDSLGLSFHVLGFTHPPCERTPTGVTIDWASRKGHAQLYRCVLQHHRVPHTGEVWKWSLLQAWLQ